MGVLVQVEVITTTMECCIAYLCSLFSEVVQYRKSVKQRKPKAAIKGACHRFSKSVSVDGQKNADKNWSVQPQLQFSFRDLIRQYVKDRSQNGGGIMIYMSSLLKYTRREDLESQRLETVWVEVNLKSYNALVCCLYRSDFTASKSLFISELQESIETALDFTPYVILACDINIDFLTLTNVQLCDCLSLFNLTNEIKEPTRITPNSSTLIDPIIVSGTCIILDSGTISVENEISNHKATYVCLQIPICLSQCYYRDVWNYKNANYNHLNDLIRQYDWITNVTHSS